jgi:hypothetical protein
MGHCAQDQGEQEALERRMRWLLWLLWFLQRFLQGWKMMVPFIRFSVAGPFGI